jgi:hypothetical protein
MQDEGCDIAMKQVLLADIDKKNQSLQNGQIWQKSSFLP